MLVLERGPPYIPAMRWIIRIIVVAWALYCVAFFVYIAAMYAPSDDAARRTDALIVLTGGNARVEHGLSLLAQQSASVLFISGVGPNVTLAEMLAAHTNQARRNEILNIGSEIVFDYDASTTQTNASEAAAFVRKRKYTSIRLVTAHYHMPRSMVEFHAALPGVTILREPVVPDSFAHKHWWRDRQSRLLIWQEFHKYLAASARTFVDRF